MLILDAIRDYVAPIEQRITQAKSFKPTRHPKMMLVYVLLNVSLSQVQLRSPDLLRSLGALTKYK